MTTHTCFTIFQFCGCTQDPSLLILFTCFMRADGFHASLVCRFKALVVGFSWFIHYKYFILLKQLIVHNNCHYCINLVTHAKPKLPEMKYNELYRSFNKVMFRSTLTAVNYFLGETQQPCILEICDVL